MSFFIIINYIGLIAFALVGALKARNHKMDIFGAGVVSFATAYGGGTLRDILLGIRPVNWLNDNYALLLVFLTCCAAFFLKNHVDKIKRTIFIADTIGLAAFTAIGILVAEQNGANSVYIVVMGVITATFGGLIADILCNEVPELLKPGELYATASAIGGLIYIFIQKIFTIPDLNILICVIVVILIRSISKLTKLKLPKI